MDCSAVKASQNGSTLHVKTHLMARLTCRGVTRQTTQTPTALLHLRFRKRNLQVCLRICLTGQEVPCQAKEYEGCRQNIPLTSNITDRLEDLWTVKHFRGVTPAKALAGARFATQPLRRTLRSGIPYGHSCALDKCIYERCCTFSKYACRCRCIKMHRSSVNFRGKLLGPRQTVTSQVTIHPARLQVCGQTPVHQIDTLETTER